METVTIVGMIYKSMKYLNFMVDQFNRYCTSSNYNIKTLIIANDANSGIIEALKKGTIPFLEYHDKSPKDYYLNRVYRAWNFGGNSAESDIIIFVNSDMAYTEGWIDTLLKYLSPTTIPCSRLVESGKLGSGQYAISKNFGQNVGDFDEKGFLSYAESIKEHRACFGGLYMPCAFYKKDFVTSGGYPEGNICAGGVGKSNTPCLRSGDDFFFHETLKSKQHLTAFDSIVYHIQEGELDESGESIKYSLLMPYYNRPTQFEMTLISFLMRYSLRKDYEVVLIEESKNIKNNEYHDTLLNIINKYSKPDPQNGRLTSINIKHLQYCERDTLNPSVMFNYGAKNSAGEILVITNPECYHEADVLKGFDREFLMDPNIYVVCGCKLVDMVPGGSYFDYKFVMWYQHSVHNNRRLHFCSAITKENYFKIGGFDEGYVDGVAFDDDDFRDTIAYRSGLTIKLRDDLVISHLNHEISNEAKRQDLIDINRNYYIRKWRR